MGRLARTRERERERREREREREILEQFASVNRCQSASFATALEISYRVTALNLFAPRNFIFFERRFDTQRKNIFCVTNELRFVLTLFKTKVILKKRGIALYF